MKEHKRKYEFETEVRVPGIEEIARVASDFSDGKEASDKPETKKKKTSVSSGAPQLDKNMSSMRSQMMQLADAVAKDDQAVQKQIKEVIETVAKVEPDNILPDHDAREREEDLPSGEDLSSGEDSTV